MNAFSPIDPAAVRLDDPVFAGRVASCRKSTIPSSVAKCRETGRIDSFRLAWKEGMPNRPHIFWDSDFAKVLEGMALALAQNPDDAELAAELDAYVDLVISAQQPDGYLNTYFTQVEPEKRWTNVFDWHELYCAGHLMEAAVAHFRATGSRKFLDALRRYADYIATVFGTGPGKLHGYPGHEEIELGLCKLADATGETKYLELAKYFIDERGREPNFFLEEAKRRGTRLYEPNLVNRQAHMPVREQADAVGHSVRALYLYIGMADVAMRTGDSGLLDACRTLFDSVANKRMYLIGGCGSTAIGEAFTVDCDLPNDTAYAESCASMAFAQFARRMADATGEARYADAMEQSLYNGCLSGISLTGDKFFYANLLTVDDTSFFHGHIARERQPWFDCSCCPTSYCRFLPQLGGFAWSKRDGELRCNIPAAGTVRSGETAIRVTGGYPYNGSAVFELLSAGSLTLSIRIPSWCRKWSAKLNGKTIETALKDGYLSLNRKWEAGDKVELELALAIDVVRANPKVTADAGKIALMRGPLVYALESTDNGPGVNDLLIPADQEFTLGEAKGLDGVPAIAGEALRETDVSGGELYFRNRTPSREKIRFTAIPYALWQNRGKSELATWLRSN
ncbi:MAG: glycoside hydrolase family 127 protein [Lentisphaeria bacterium]|nr:glycoside hydrolase family 127 protein [Lentisphaeria bacterium]